MRIAKVIPIHKKNSKLIISNYRPISILSNLDKILEKLMYSRLMKFIDNQKILYLKQFGFWKEFSTSHAVISLIENIQKNVDDKQIACGVFIDLEKAFDTVGHTLLLNKLFYYGIRGIANRLFKSYSSNRTQYISINGFSSNHKLMKYGVPQGLVLGPLPFLIFINDLNYTIINSTTFHFADDIYLFNVKQSIKEINKSVNKDLESFLHWFNAKKLSLNVTKIKVDIFKAKGKVSDTDLKLKMCGKRLYPSHHENI